jgi:hypothetical protein
MFWWLQAVPVLRPLKLANPHLSILQLKPAGQLKGFSPCMPCKVAAAEVHLSTTTPTTVKGMSSTALQCQNAVGHFNKGQCSNGFTWYWVSVSWTANMAGWTVYLIK